MGMPQLIPRRIWLMQSIAFAQLANRKLLLERREDDGPFVDIHVRAPRKALGISV
jgi:hypothetical protein